MVEYIKNLILSKGDSNNIKLLNMYFIEILSDRSLDDELLREYFPDIQPLFVAFLNDLNPKVKI